MINLWNRYKNIVVKSLCYITIVCILMMCLGFNYRNLLRVESVLANEQYENDMHGVVTSDFYEILGNVNREKPGSFGKFPSSEYPSFNNALKEIEKEKRIKIYNENIAMYDDIELAIENGSLMKHNSADWQFGGVIGEDVRAVVKKTYINSLVKGTHSLGVYAPAGEILTIEIDRSMVDKGLKVVVGYESEVSDISLEQFLSEVNISRMPIIRKSFSLNSEITRVGTPLGGTVYLMVPISISEDFSVVVSGGIDNPVFQLGVNTEKDLEDMLLTSGLTMEFKLPYVRLIMPKEKVKMAEKEVINALEMWHKMTSVSAYVLEKGGQATPVVIYYDTFTNSMLKKKGYGILPVFEVDNALNYKQLMYYGSYNNFYEFNKVYCESLNISLENCGVLNVLGYLLYTDIALIRSEENSLSDNKWNVTADPYYNYKTLLSISKNISSFEELGENKLYMYSQLIHEFGISKFIDFIKSCYKEGISSQYDINVFAIKASEIFQSDLTYFFVEICKIKLKEDTLTEIKNLNYEPYLPFYNLYSSGVNGVETGRAFLIEGRKYLFDFSKYMITPFEYEIEKINTSMNGSLKKRNDGTYEYFNRTGQQDSFSIIYKIKYGNKEYYKTLNYKINFKDKSNNINEYSIVYDLKSELIKKKYKNMYLNKIDNIQINMNGQVISDIENLYDRDKSTAFLANAGDFPHEYVIRFSNTASFDNIKLYFADDELINAVGQYELYISNDNKNYKLISKGDNEDEVLEIQYDKEYKAKYVKLIVNSNVKHKKYTSISEIEVSNSIDFSLLNYYSSNNDKLDYINNWNFDYLNNNFNGVKASGQDGSKLQFSFEGEELAVFSSVDSSYKIKIDDQKWVKVNCVSENIPSFILKGLEDGEHSVVIESLSDETDIQLVGIKGKVRKKNIYCESFVEFYKIIISIALSILLVKGSLYIFEKRYNLWEKIKKSISNIIQRIHV